MFSDIVFRNLRFMRIPRIYIDKPLSTGDSIQLDEPAFQHAIKVLRLRVDDQIILFNGIAGEYPASLIEVSKKQAVAHIEQFLDNDSESSLAVHLALGISKGERMDFAIQKAVELGVTEITPVYSERCVVNLDAKREAKRLQHWQGIIISACEQCGRNRIPVLHKPVDIRKHMSLLPETDLKLTLSPYAEQNLKQLPVPGKAVLILIGPEGGLSQQEISAAKQHGFTAVRMGPRILRTETAALTAISAIQVLWGDLAS
ncbi:MAG: 16S rRNA (uracil(1498)-N(3))-methyltransferase [Thioalkalispiraceae bacterium]